MKLILHPKTIHVVNDLRNAYTTAFSEAEELFIASAYLTEWDKALKLNKGCKELTIVVGTDFHITRKKALKDLLAWLPKEKKADFFVADKIGGFHPKLLAWKTSKGNCFVLLGSSNLTKAAFESNYEANAFSEIEEASFNEISNWMYEIRGQSRSVSEGWISKYEEAKHPPVVKDTDRATDYTDEPSNWCKLPPPKSYSKKLDERRDKMRVFLKNGRKLRKSIFDCAAGKIDSLAFYESMEKLWGKTDARFQNIGIERTCKTANWQDVCLALKEILAKDVSTTPLARIDNLVKFHIDKLAEEKNPTRRAWLSEMLCQFFPDKYPLLNEPVRAWLVNIGHTSPRGASEGAKYIDLAQKLRLSLRENKNYPATNLAEVDQVIWQWFDTKKKRIEKRVKNES